ncbi:sulfotransferase family protein [Flindersiella endophytica]
MLKVIGAGLPRTGTASIKAALDRLGFGPCYHGAHDLRAHPEHIDRWLYADTDDAPDWDRVFDGYQSAQDWPAGLFWRELARFYPDAKVLLSVRDPHAWYQSFRTLMTRPRKAQGEALRAAGMTMRRIAPLMTKRGRAILGPDWKFGPEMPEDEAGLVAAFHRHTATVKAELPADRLLVFDVRQGWEPLCDFLGVEPPAEPFPHLNSAESQQQIWEARTEGRLVSPFDAEVRK